MARERVQGDKGSWRKMEGGERVGKIWQIRIKTRPCQCVRCSSLGLMGHATMLIPQLHWALILHRFQEVCWCWTFLENTDLFFGNTLPTESIRLAGFCLAWATGSPVLKPRSHFSFGSKSNLKRFPLPSSQTMCAHCLHAHQHGFLPSFLPPYSQSLAVRCVCGRRLWTEETGTVQRGVRQASSTKDAFLNSSPSTEQHSPTATHSTASWRCSQAKSANRLFTEEGLELPGQIHARESIHTEIRGWSTPSCGLSSRPANGRAPWACPGCKICTWQQLLLHSCLMWGLFSLPISELESWNELHWKSTTWSQNRTVCHS